MIHFDLSKKEEKIASLELLTHQEDFWKDQKKSKKIIFEMNHLKKLLNDYFALSKKVKNLFEEICALEKETDYELLELLTEEYLETFRLFKE